MPLFFFYFHGHVRIFSFTTFYPFKRETLEQLFEHFLRFREFCGFEGFLIFVFWKTSRNFEWSLKRS